MRPAVERLDEVSCVAVCGRRARSSRFGDAAGPTRGKRVLTRQATHPDQALAHTRSWLGWRIGGGLVAPDSGKFMT